MNTIDNARTIALNKFLALMDIEMGSIKFPITIFNGSKGIRVQCMGLKKGESGSNENAHVGSDDVPVRGGPGK